MRQGHPRGRVWQIYRTELRAQKPAIVRVVTVSVECVVDPRLVHLGSLAQADHVPGAQMIEIQMNIIVKIQRGTHM